MDLADFSPALDEAAIAAARQSYAETGVARIVNPLSDAAARALHAHLTNDLDWSLVFNEGLKIWDIDPDKVEALWASEYGPIVREAIMASARKGFQYQHYAVRVSDDPAERT